ncbi:MAG: protein-disulfide reductase DsbD domain-containing protein [Janthinobacterium lividum]
MNKIMLLYILPVVGAGLLLAPLSTSAQSGGPKIATVSAVSKPASVVRGGKGVLFVTVSVKPNYHINANKPNDPDYIATVFTVQPVSGVQFGPAHYPAAKLVKVSYSPKPLLVYMGQATLSIPFTVTKAAAPGMKMLTGSVSYQGCNATSCYPPTSAPVTVRVTVK